MEIMGGKIKRQGLLFEETLSILNYSISRIIFTIIKAMLIKKLTTEITSPIRFAVEFSLLKIITDPMP